MLSLILLISVMCLVVLLKKLDDYPFNNGGLLCLGTVISALLSLVFGFLVIGGGFAYIDTFNIDEKIDIYIYIKKKIKKLNKMYQRL